MTGHAEGTGREARSLLSGPPARALLLLGALAAVQMVHYYPLLPDPVAVHFGPSGAANGWSSKAGFAALYGGMEALVVLFGLGLAALLGKVPVGMLNVSNKDYWFAPERRPESIEFLKSHLLWMESATVAFLIALAQIIFATNLGDSPPKLSNDFWFVLVAFVAVVLWLSLRIILRFRAPR